MHHNFRTITRSSCPCITRRVCLRIAVLAAGGGDLRNLRLLLSDDKRFLKDWPAGLEGVDNGVVPSFKAAGFA